MIPEGKMAQILADVHVMESVIESTINYPDSAVMVYNKRHKEILQQHKVSSEAFHDTYDYYAANLAEMDRLYEAVLDTLTTREAKLIAKKGGLPGSDQEMAPVLLDDSIPDTTRTREERVRLIDRPLKAPGRPADPELERDNP
nr:DUF4296 domain-containing protein [Pontibacter sp. Tf4]